MARQSGVLVLELRESTTPSPSASLVQYQYFRDEGFESDRASLAAAGSFLFPMLGRFLLPPVAFVVLWVSGEIHGTVAGAAAISLAITAALGLLAWLLLRTERSARWLGARVGRPLGWLLRIAKREPVDDPARRTADLRSRSLDILRAGWRTGSAGVAANLAITYLILLGCLRSTGVSSTTLSSPDAFAAFALAFWAGAVLPITGSGLGVVDAVLIAMLFELSGADDDALVAAALLWRVFYSLVILPFGALTLGHRRPPEV